MTPPVDQRREAFAIVEAAVRCVCDQPNLRLDRSASRSTVPRWDSLTHTGLVLEVEQRAGIELDADVALAATTVDELVQLIVSAWQRTP